MNYCPSCGTANRDGSRFCNECGHKLPSKTGIICPMCSHVNPAANVYCDNCRARLVPLTAASQPTPPASAKPAPNTGGAAAIKKGLSLPTKPDDQAERLEAEPLPESEPETEPDWLIKLRAAAPKASEIKSAEPPADEPATGDIPDWMRPTEGEEPDWFKRITEAPPTPPAPRAAAEPATPTDADSLPDWVKALDRAAPAEPAPPAEEPDWLSEAHAEAANDRVEDAPDWLSALQASPPADSQPAATDTAIDWLTQPAADDDVPDWLKQMDDRPAPPAPAQSAPVPQPPVADVDVPDWLTNLGSPSEAAAPSHVEPEPALESDVPDWLTGLRSQPEAEPPHAEPEPAVEGDVPDWLAGLRSQPEAEPSHVEPEPAVEGDVPDWLAGLQSQPDVGTSHAEPEASIESDVPAWLSGLQSQPDAGTPPVAPEFVAESDEPDWLSSLRTSPQVETPPAPEAAVESDVPDWLADVRAAPVTETPSAPAGEQPAWLTDWPSQPETPVSDEPDWLRHVSGPSDTSTAEPAAAEPAVEGDVPDWLRGLGPARSEPEPADDATGFAGGMVGAFAGEDMEPAAPTETPTWLTDLDQPKTPAVASPPATPPAEIPAWLRDLGPLPKSPARAEETPFGEAPPPEPSQVPDWLQAGQAGQPAPAFADESGRPIDALAGGPDLETGAIPSWLQALRPSQAAPTPVAVTEDGVVETEGMLAGLRNVLPIVPAMGTTQGAPAVTQINIPAADLAHAGLFQELLARGSLAPTTMQLSASRRSRIGERVLGVVLLVVFIIAIVLPKDSKLVANYLFQLGSVETALYQPAYDQLQTLNAGDQVLMAFDYDAFQTGEMEPIAQALLVHLQQRGVEINVASLTPSGASLAAHALYEAGLVPTTTFASRTYFPGQAIGARGALSGSSAKLIIVLAGSPEVLRWWVEQSTADGARPPIVAGLSAGVLPQARPYLDSGQVKAAVVGLIGGLAYQRGLVPDPQNQDAGDAGLNRLVRSEGLYLVQILFAGILLFGVIFSLVFPSTRRTP